MFHDILQFWFHEISPKQWWSADPEFDRLIASRFLDVHRRANQGEFYEWRADPKGRLADVIILDQFSRNIFRGQAEAFASDRLALALSQEAVAAKADLNLSDDERVFLYMPYMHSESKVIHVVAEGLFRAHGPKGNYDFELRHKAIIDRFGRYPHRNEILGRDSSPEEIAFLKEPGSSF
jgi:uncharacterized protein (DUF924 family)